MRTPPTPDNDAARLEADAHRSGRPCREAVNETLRHGLASQRLTSQQQAFAVEARDLGDLTPGLSLDKVAELIAQVEGPAFQ